MNNDVFLREHETIRDDRSDKIVIRLNMRVSPFVDNVTLINNGEGNEEA